MPGSDVDVTCCCKRKHDKQHVKKSHPQKTWRPALRAVIPNRAASSDKTATFTRARNVLPTAHLPTFQGGTSPAHRRAMTFILCIYYGPLSQSWDSPPSDAGQVVHLCLEPSRMLLLPVVLALFDRWEDDAPLDELLRYDQTCGGPCCGKTIRRKKTLKQKRRQLLELQFNGKWAGPQQKDETKRGRQKNTAAYGAEKSDEYRRCLVPSGHLNAHNS